jgi:hypothetical protein
MPQVAELRFAPFGLLEQSSVGIRGRFMGLVGPLLLVKVDQTPEPGAPSALLSIVRSEILPFHRDAIVETESIVARATRE